jgi:hypothetical protein
MVASYELLSTDSQLMKLNCFQNGSRAGTTKASAAGAETTEVARHLLNNKLFTKLGERKLAQIINPCQEGNRFRKLITDLGPKKQCQEHDFLNVTRSCFASDFSRFGRDNLEPKSAVTDPSC